MFSLRTNGQILIKMIMKWPCLTFLVVTIFALSNGYYLNVKYGMDPLDTIFPVVGGIFILLFFKNIFLLSFFNILFKEEFDGSLSVLSLFNAMFFVVAILLISITVNNNVKDFPMAELKWLLPIVLFQVFLLNLIALAFLNKVAKNKGIITLFKSWMKR